MTTSTESSRTRANRRNAKRSTGPKSQTGKRRVAQNARRHGLAVPIASVPAADASIERLARLIAGDNADEHRHQLARRIAEAELDLIRIRRARAALLAQQLADPFTFLPTSKLITLLKLSVDATMSSSNYKIVEYKLDKILRYWPTARPELGHKVDIMLTYPQKLLRLDRYERRALSRRKFAIRDWDAQGA